MNVASAAFDLALIMCIWVFIVDLADFRGTVLDIASRFLGGPVKSLKPITCSLCMTWWTGLAYLIVTGRLSIPGVALVAAASILTQPVGAFLGAVLDLVNKLIDKINNQNQKDNDLQ